MGIPPQYLMVFRQRLPRWDIIYNACVEFLHGLIQGKADANHTHGAGGQVVGIGQSTSRPAVADGFLHSEVDVHKVALLDAGGGLRDYLAGEAYLAMQARELPSLMGDDSTPPDVDTTYGGLLFANAGAWAWGDFEAWLAGVAWRVVLEGMMTTGSASGVGLGVAYLVAGTSSGITGLVKTRRKNSTAYALNDSRIPPTPNGHYYKCTTAGTSGATVPTWATGSGSTTTDGTVVWTEQGTSFKPLTLTVTAPATAYQRFDVDSASLQIPVGGVAQGDRVYLAVWRDGADAHAGGLVLTRLAIQPVAV